MYDPNRAYIDPFEAQSIWLRYAPEDDYTTYIKCPLWISDGNEVELNYYLYKEVPRSVEMNNGNMSEYWMLPGALYPFYNENERRHLTEEELIIPPPPTTIYSVRRVFNESEKKLISDDYEKKLSLKNKVNVEKIEKLIKLRDMMAKDNILPWQNVPDYVELYHEINDYITLLKQQIK